MTPTSAELVERVREALNRLSMDGPVTQAEYCGPADAALTALAERLEATEEEIERLRREVRKANFDATDSDGMFPRNPLL